MKKQSLFLILLLLSLFTGLISCTKSTTPSPNKTTSLVFDTLQGKWMHSKTVYIKADGFAQYYIVTYSDSTKFNPDLTGIDHIPQAPVNFTYQLLPDDSTLIFNTGTFTNPVLDTVTIMTINATTLTYHSKIKNLTWPFVGNYNLISFLNK